MTLFFWMYLKGITLTFWEFISQFKYFVLKYVASRYSRMHEEKNPTWFFIHLKVTHLIRCMQSSSKFAWKFYQSKNCVVVLVSNLAMFRFISNHFSDSLLLAGKSGWVVIMMHSFVPFETGANENEKCHTFYFVGRFSQVNVCVCGICSQDGMFLQMCPHQFIRYISFVCVTCVARLMGLQNVLNQR